MGKNLNRLSPDEKKQLREYIMSIKEIKKQISELVQKASVEENESNPHNNSSGLMLNVNEE